MAEENFIVPGRKSFEDMKQLNQHGAEYWTARDLQPSLGYRHWRTFQKAIDAGYKGLYGGLGRDDIKARKRIPPKQNLMDRMGTTELAANQFRMTQTREKLSREGIRDPRRAITAHNEVGKEVRDAIKRIGGALPEDLPPAEHIKDVQKRLAAAPQIPLEDKDAQGLAGGETP